MKLVCLDHFYKENNLFGFNTEVCLLPRVAGPCEGNYPAWYHDSETGTCKQFRYGGCLGNNNRFETLEECDSKCIAPKLVGKLPFSPPLSLAA